MTTSTTDAEAIARIIDPNAVADAIGYAEMKGYTESETQELIKASARIANAIEKATAILSYLTSRREAQEPVAWPEPKVTSPDIADPTGVPYIDCLLHRLLDAQQDINFEANSRMSQSLCDVSSLVDELETAIRFLARRTAPPAPAGEVERLRAALRIARGYVEDDAKREPSEYDPHEDLKRIDAALNGGRE